jgi:RES domain-containing protein
VIFAAESLALACLERFVHADPVFEPTDLVAIEIVLDSKLSVDAVEPSALPAGWRDYPAPEALTRVGERWLTEARSVALLVPSAIVPRERNVLLNPRHSQFSGVRARSTEPFTFDPRLWKTRP